MSVADLFSRVVELEQRLGLPIEGMNYSDRLLNLLDALDFQTAEANDETPTVLDEGALEDHLARLQNMVDNSDDNQPKQLDGTMEEVMARIESQLKTSAQLKD